MLKNNQPFLRKLEYLSKYRGCKESEIIFERFVERYLTKLDTDQLKDYERILECTDAELMDWFLRKKETPRHIINNSVYNLVMNCLEV